MFGTSPARRWAGAGESVGRGERRQREPEFGRPSPPLAAPAHGRREGLQPIYSFVFHSYPKVSPGSRRSWMSIVDCRTDPAALLTGEVGVGRGGGPTPGERRRKNGLHARPHPGPLPPVLRSTTAEGGQERGRQARNVCGKRRALVLAQLLSGRATTRAMEPRPSSFQIAPGTSPSARGCGQGKSRKRFRPTCCWGVPPPAHGGA